jgi:hypothetical protein
MRLFIETVATAIAALSGVPVAFQDLIPPAAR